MASVTNVKQLVVNKMTQVQYDNAVKNPDELYLTPDDGDYSTTEQDTGYKWIDGKNVYRKTITGSISLSANVAGYVTTTTVVDSLINVYGSWKNWENQYTLFGAYQTGQWSSAYRDSNSNKIVLAFLADNSGSKTYKITILYTK